MRTVTRGTIQVTALLLLLLGAGASLQGSDRRLGDLFVAVGGGQYQVWRLSGTTATLVETITDSVGGSSGTAGCALDSTYHPYTTNVSADDVFRRTLDDPQTIIQTINTGTGGQPTSIAFDGAGNFYVGQAAGTGLIEKYGPSGNFLGTLPVNTNKLTKGSAWVDLSADSQTVYFTDGTNAITQFGITSSQTRRFAGIGGATLYALRVLTPDARAATAGLTGGPGVLLVAAVFSNSSDIQLLNASGTTIKTYSVAGENNFRVLTLDANGKSFWAGNPSTHNFYRFSLATGAVEASVAGSAGPSGMCVYGGFSAAQPQPITVTATLTPENPTLDTPIPPTCNLLTTTCNHFTSTLFGLTQNVETILQYSQIAPATGNSDPSAGSLPCLKTAPDGKHCEVFAVSMSASEPAFASHDLAIFSTQSSLNPVVLRNEATDVTDFVVHGSTRVGGSCSTCSSTYTAHEQPIQEAGSTSCGYTSPIPNSVFNQGRTIPFKFRAVPNVLDCLGGPFLTDLTPRLVIVQLTNLTTVFDAPHPVSFTSGGSGTAPFYSLSGSQWILNVDSSTLQGAVNGIPTLYLATTIDDSHQIPSFTIGFAVE
jgi:hypothetical protein